MIRKKKAAYQLSSTRSQGEGRRILVEAAFAILSEDGVEAVTLGAVAKRVGVTRAAPPHHFPGGRKELLGELAKIGFEDLVARLRAAEARGAETAVRASCRAFFDFARTSRGAVLMPVMFRPELLPPFPEAPHLSLLRADALQLVGDRVAAFVRSKDAERVVTLTVFCWSTMLGLAQLLADGSLRDVGVGTEQDPIGPDALVAKAIDFVIAGLRAR